MRCVAVDAEHPGGRMEEGFHVRTRDGLVVLHRVNLRGHAGSGPRGSFVVGPFDGHAEQGVHVEFHDAAGPRVDVDVRVIGVRNGQQWVVDVLARVVQHGGHANQIAGHHGGGTAGSVAVGTHEEGLRLGDPHRWLEGGHADAVVGAHGMEGRVSTFEHEAVVAPCVHRAGHVVPGQFGTFEVPHGWRRSFRFDFFSTKATCQRQGQHHGGQQKGHRAHGAVTSASLREVHASSETEVGLERYRRCLREFSRACRSSTDFP